MKTTTLEEGVANWERLQRFVAIAEEARPSLKRRGERFSKRLAESQERNLAKILARPGSKAYRDYIETPARFSVPIPES
jgi:hypothetical protein